MTTTPSRFSGTAAFAPAGTPPPVAPELDAWTYLVDESSEIRSERDRMSDLLDAVLDAARMNADYRRLADYRKIGIPVSGNYARAFRRHAVEFGDAPWLGYFPALDAESLRIVADAVTARG